MNNIRFLVTSVLALMVLGVPPVRAEVIELLDKTKMSGTVVHYYDGVFTIEAGGNTVKVPRDKIRSIQYDLPAPRKEFSSPQKTFDRWRNALTSGDMEAVIDCYALMYQGFLAAQMGQGGDAVKKMQEELEGTRFTVKGSSTSKAGDTATLKVVREKDNSSDTGEIAFVRENGEWKMLPPQ